MNNDSDCQNCGGISTMRQETGGLGDTLFCLRCYLSQASNAAGLQEALRRAWHEIERLRMAIRGTHALCIQAGWSKGQRHDPGCIWYELDARQEEPE